MKDAEVGEAASASVGFRSGGGGGAYVNVWMIDNQPAFREVVVTALRRASDLVLGGYFVHPEDALVRDSGLRPPDIILIDVEEFGDEGFEAMRKLTAAFDGVPWIILTHALEENSISNAICAGASGYLLKSSSLGKIPEAIQEALRGGALLAPAVARCVLEMFRRLSGARQDGGLTTRELSILDLMGQGLVMKQIAEQLEISYHTVDTHSRNIYAKLGVHSRAGAVAKALRARII